MQYYQISCNFNKQQKNAKKILQYLKNHYHLKLAKCCKIDFDYQDEDTIYYVCQSCREVLANKTNASIVSIWTLIDQDPAFPFPDLQGKSFVLQDCYRDKNHPEIHNAIANILKKMNVNMIEIKENKENSIFCGNIHYETDNQEILEEIAQYPGVKTSHLPESLQVKMMEDYCKRFEGYEVITYCNRCNLCINKGGIKAYHLLDLIFDQM